jgi:DnaA family protein
MEQLTFELASPEARSFANFLTGRNEEAVVTLARLAAGDIVETGVVLWGGPGVGKTHLLQATLGAAAGRRITLFCADCAAVPAEAPAPHALVAVDGVDAADPQQQGRLFSLYNALKASGGQLLAAAEVPPALMRLRDDVRTRLGWGLVYEVLPLADGDKPAALAAYARSRGVALPDDVIGYLLAHGRRDMASLLATLLALDRYSLANKRPITLPLLKEWLQRSLGLQASPESSRH